ncbi:MAG TPA: hypothetical protein VIJ96_05985 [Acidothermaceae bacterium]
MAEPVAAWLGAGARLPDAAALDEPADAALATGETPPDALALVAAAALVDAGELVELAVGFELEHAASTSAATVPIPTATPVA